MKRIDLHVSLFLLMLAGPASAQEFDYEVQVNVCETEESLASKLALKTPGKSRSTYLFDTPKLDLNQLGLAIRLRVSESGELHLAVKAQGLTEPRMRELAKSSGATCEYDVHDRKRIGSCTAKKDLATQKVDPQRMAAVVRSALTRDQTTLLGSATSHLAGIEALGPSVERHWKLAELHDELQISRTPNGPSFIEISRRTSDKPDEVSDELLRHLKGKNISACPDQAAQRHNHLEALQRARPR